MFPVQLITLIVPVILKAFKWAAKKTGWSPSRELMLGLAPTLGVIFAVFGGVDTAMGLEAALETDPTTLLATVTEGGAYGAAGTWIHQSLAKTDAGNTLTEFLERILIKKPSAKKR